MAPMAHVSKWHKENNWHARCVAYDGHLDEIIRSEREAILRQCTRDVSAEQMSMLANARQICAIEFARILEVTKNAGSGASAVLKPAEVIKLTDIVVKLERLVRDQSTENTTKTTNLGTLSAEEFEAYGRLLEKIDASEAEAPEPAKH